MVGEGKGVMLKGYHERIRRHDLKVRGEEQQVKWGRVIWRYYRRVYNSNLTIGTMHNEPLAYAPTKEYHPPILGTQGAHGGQVNKDIYIYPNHPLFCKPPIKYPPHHT